MQTSQATPRKWSYEGIGYRLMFVSGTAVFIGFFILVLDFYFTGTSPVGLPLDYREMALGLGFLSVGFLLAIWGMALLHRPKELERTG